MTEQKNYVFEFSVTSNTIKDADNNECKQYDEFYLIVKRGEFEEHQNIVGASTLDSLFQFNLYKEQGCFVDKDGNPSSNKTNAANLTGQENEYKFKFNTPYAGEYHYRLFGSGKNPKALDLIKSEKLTTEENNYNASPYSKVKIAHLNEYNINLEDPFEQGSKKIKLSEEATEGETNLKVKPLEYSFQKSETLSFTQNNVEITIGSDAPIKSFSIGTITEGSRIIQDGFYEEKSYNQYINVTPLEEAVTIGEAFVFENNLRFEVTKEAAQGDTEIEGKLTGQGIIIKNDVAVQVIESITIQNPLPKDLPADSEAFIIDNRSSSSNNGQLQLISTTNSFYYFVNLPENERIYFNTIPKRLIKLGLKKQNANSSDDFLYIYNEDLMSFYDGSRNEFLEIFSIPSIFFSFPLKKQIDEAKAARKKYITNDRTVIKESSTEEEESSTEEDYLTSNNTVFFDPFPENLSTKFILLLDGIDSSSLNIYEKNEGKTKQYIVSVHSYGPSQYNSDSGLEDNSEFFEKLDDETIFIPDNSDSIIYEPSRIEGKTIYVSGKNIIDPNSLYLAIKNNNEFVEGKNEGDGYEDYIYKTELEENFLHVRSWVYAEEGSVPTLFFEAVPYSGLEKEENVFGKNIGKGKINFNDNLRIYFKNNEEEILIPVIDTTGGTNATTAQLQELEGLEEVDSDIQISLKDDMLSLYLVVGDFVFMRQIEDLGILTQEENLFLNTVASRAENKNVEVKTIKTPRTEGEIYFYPHAVIEKFNEHIHSLRLEDFEFTEPQQGYASLDDSEISDYLGLKKLKVKVIGSPTGTPTGGWPEDAEEAEKKPTLFSAMSFVNDDGNPNGSNGMYLEIENQPDFDITQPFIFETKVKLKQSGYQTIFHLHNGNRENVRIWLIVSGGYLKINVFNSGSQSTGISVDNDLKDYHILVESSGIKGNENEGYYINIKVYTINEGTEGPVLTEKFSENFDIGETDINYINSTDDDYRSLGLTLGARRDEKERKWRLHGQFSQVLLTFGILGKSLQQYQVAQNGKYPKDHKRIPVILKNPRITDNHDSFTVSALKSNNLSSEQWTKPDEIFLKQDGNRIDDGYQFSTVDIPGEDVFIGFQFNPTTFADATPANNSTQIPSPANLNDENFEKATEGIEGIIIFLSKNEFTLTKEEIGSFQKMIQIENNYEEDSGYCYFYKDRLPEQWPVSTLQRNGEYLRTINSKDIICRYILNDFSKMTVENNRISIDIEDIKEWTLKTNSAGYIQDTVHMIVATFTKEVRLNNFEDDNLPYLTKYPMFKRTTIDFTAQGQRRTVKAKEIAYLEKSDGRIYIKYSADEAQIAASENQFPLYFYVPTIIQEPNVNYAISGDVIEYEPMRKFSTDSTDSTDSEVQSLKLTRSFLAEGTEISLGEMHFKRDSYDQYTGDTARMYYQIQGLRESVYGKQSLIFKFKAEEIEQPEEGSEVVKAKVSLVATAVDGNEESSFTYGLFDEDAIFGEKMTLTRIDSLPAGKSLKFSGKDFNREDGSAGDLENVEFERNNIDGYFYTRDITFPKMTFFGSESLEEDNTLNYVRSLQNGGINNQFPYKSVELSVEGKVFVPAGQETKTMSDLVDSLNGTAGILGTSKLMQGWVPGIGSF